MNTPEQFGQAFAEFHVRKSFGVKTIGNSPLRELSHTGTVRHSYDSRFDGPGNLTVVDPRRIRPGTLRLPSLRTALTRVHKDLFAIDKLIKWDRDDPLLPVEKMTLILEDRRFFMHNGIDFRSCLRELFRMLTAQPFGGASTIDMQFVRTATQFREKTIRRKLYEMFLARIIQYRYNKMQVLRSYLGCAYFGSHLYGLDAICKEVYSKEPEALSLSEAAEVAAMLVYPRPRVPTAEWRAKVSRRANYGMRLYPRFEKTFDKLPRWEVL